MHNLKLVNVDTDAILVQKPNGEFWTEEEQDAFLEELNNQFPEKIQFDHDGYFDTVIVVRAKNYILKEHGTNKIKIKGSAFKSSTKEPALASLMKEIIDAILEDKQNTVVDIYEKYVKEAVNIQDISRWCAKKTITEPVLACKGYVLKTELRPNSKEMLMPKKVYYIKGKEVDIRTNEVAVWDAIKNEELIQQGDKIYLYPTKNLSIIKIKPNKAKKTKKEHTQKIKIKAEYSYGLEQSKKWNKNSPNHDVQQLLKRLYDTMGIFSTVLDINQFKNYALSKNYKELLDK